MLDQREIAARQSADIVRLLDLRASTSERCGAAKLRSEI